MRLFAVLLGVFLGVREKRRIELRIRTQFLRNADFNFDVGSLDVKDGLFLFTPREGRRQEKKRGGAREKADS